MDVLIDTRKSVLSGEMRLYKTQRFINETKQFGGIDAFVSRLAGGIILSFGELARLSRRPPQSGKIACFKVETKDKNHTFFFVFGKDANGCGEGVREKDIIFFAYSHKRAYTLKNDDRLTFYLGLPSFYITVDGVSIPREGNYFNKLYRLSNSQLVNFPLLSAEQKRIVETEDKNLLVQGAAGSGKTNVCIDKIVYSACREYSGRVLYTTFSRGLLTDTETKVKEFQNNLTAFVAEYEAGRIIFADGERKKAIENRLGIYFSVDDDDKIIEKVKRAADFLNNNVDYFLIEDLYSVYSQNDAERLAADERYFVDKYIGDIKNHRLKGKLARPGELSYEVIYKEIYGLILGACDPNDPFKTLSYGEYLKKRGSGFTVPECELIYSLAKDYEAHLEARGMTDNNAMSRELCKRAGSIKKYSLTIVDEVQDMTEINLFLMKSISVKLFCVGDALQMINPSYFSFAYLKRLLFEKDTVSVAELSNNYRSTKLIGDIAEELGRINMRQFGVHSFVLKTTGIDAGSDTSAVFVRDAAFADMLEAQRFNNYTVIVSGAREKEALRKILKKQEILTVAEAKGLERETVVLYRVLSDNIDKWKALERSAVNRKQADENSVYRYYFNLFYVGVSRAKSHIYIAEEREAAPFKDLFKNRFKNLSAKDAVADLLTTSDQSEIEQEEISERIAEFIRLGQYDNARFAVAKLSDETEKALQTRRIEIFETFVKHGKYRDAGVKFWEYSMTDDAKKQFELSGDGGLCRLVDAAAAENITAPTIDIVKLFPSFSGDAAAAELILETASKDFGKLAGIQKDLNEKLKSLSL
ncbi:MAG: AAA family ATPase [Clostridiales bacterium]|jgi:superfamily I DNA/RNA helicase|nr:AAA family ATPase [Clostridiales bacterium]